MVNGVVCIVSSGVWQSLPRVYGSWQTVNWDLPTVASRWYVGA
jgi:hypothetical protein